MKAVAMVLALVMAVAALGPVVTWAQTSAVPAESVLTAEQVAQAEFEMGVQFMRERKFASAAPAFERAVAARPDFAEAYTNWGIALVQLARQSGSAEQQLALYSGAVEKFAKAAELQPQARLNYLLWSETLVLLGDLPLDGRVRLACYQGAVERCRKAVELQPQDWEAYNKWAVILSTKLPEFAVNEEARLQLFKEAAALFGKAAESVRFSGEIGPVYANWAGALVQAARAAGEREQKQALLREALEKFERSARAIPNSAGTYAMWGSALVELGKLTRYRGDFREGVNKLSTALELKPNDPGILYNLACAYALMDNPLMAVQTLRKCLEFDSANTFRAAAAQDPDLASLRGDRAFEELMNPPAEPRGRSR
jgi:Flp pilus assembly protein TadD